MSAAALTCKELVELVTAYLEGRLSLHDQARFDEHLAECTACPIYIEQMRQTISLMGELREETISKEARDELIAIFRHWKRE
jgi:predicted anti-sigma-YlaC factor YlaD